jgi:H+/Cl- antiporter ClcA
MDMELQFALESFQRWFSGERLTSNESTVIVLSIILCVLSIITIALLVYLSRITLFWTRIGWFFEDVWHWFKRYTMPVPGTSLCDDDLTEEDVHEIMDIIHKGNPPKYKIKKNKNGRNFVELENQKK